jgi:serine/threonine-protein kinase
MRLGLDGPSLSLSDQGPAVTVDLQPSVLETIAETVGPVPRVLLRDTAPGEEPGPIVRPTSVGDVLIRYRIDGEIARGGMGAVLKGRDPDLNRDVALKVLRDELRDRPEAVRRFVEEAQIGGQLQHPGIVPIYELGTFADRRPFFSMKLVKGQTLAALLAGRSTPAAELPRFLAIFEAVCQTVAYAHARGVIHRDLKPSNVMVGSFGEVQVMDWGLAKVLPRGEVADDAQAGQAKVDETVIATARSGSGDPELSRAGAVLGTPRYMAPEQARGEVVDERADVFALGSILCEILTGAPAFAGRTSGEIQRTAALGDTADALSRLETCGADAELIALAKLCLGRELQDRPRQAGIVAWGITAYLTGVQERIKTADRERAVAEARAVEERKRRHLQLGLAGCLVALTALGGLGAAYSLRQRAEHAAAVARLLGEAETLHGVAVRAPEDLARWDAASAAVRQAEAATESAGDRAVLSRVAVLRDAVRAGADAARSDRTLLDAVAEIRASKYDLGAAGADEAYRRAFQQAELDLDTRAPAGFGARLRARPPSVVRAVAAALDDWALVRRADRPDRPEWARPLEVAREGDPDPFRNRIRAALLAHDDAALRALAEDRAAAELPPESAVLLALATPDIGRSVALLRAAAGRHPNDVWVNYTLAGRLGVLSPAPRVEQVRYYSAARAARPDSAHELAHLLDAMGRGDEALAVFADLAARRSGNGRHLLCYGLCLKDHGRPEAARLLERAVAAGLERVRQRPEDIDARLNLGLALRSTGKADDAMTAYREAVRRNPDRAEAHAGLAAVLDQVGKPNEAAEEVRTAIRLRPSSAEAHNDLGVYLAELGKPAESIAEHRAAIRLRPDFALAHYNLGISLSNLGRWDEAGPEFRTAVRLKPDYAEAHYNLGRFLRAQGKPDEAIAEYRAAIALKADYPEAHCNLGLLLREAGDYAGALGELRKGHELGLRRADWRYPSAEWVRQGERAVQLAARLPAVMRGDDRPHDEAERVEFAQMAYERGRFVLSAGLWAEALAANPALGAPRLLHRYNAACIAALAAAGRARDESPPDDAARARLRAQALGWLQADLAAWVKHSEMGNNQARAEAAATLVQWQADPDLAGVRGPAALDRLPEAERAAWRALWDEVERVGRRARAAP